MVDLPPPAEYLALDLESLSPEEILWAGIGLFNAGHYWYAHEVWEATWKSGSKQMQHLFQGLIQFAAGLHHAQNGNQHGFEKLLERARTSFSKFRGPSPIIDVQKITNLLDDARHSRWQDGVAEILSTPPQLPAQRI